MLKRWRATAKADRLPSEQGVSKPTHQEHASPYDPAWELTAAQVSDLMSRDDEVILLDCRTPKEWAIAKVDGAMLVEMQEIPSRLPELEEFAERPIVTMCHLGVRSMKVAMFLREQGFENVRSMAGGIDAWSLQVDQAVPRY